LTTQVEDLRRAMEDLRSVMEDLDEHIKKRFFDFGALGLK
jgi:chromosome segregation ATPase